MYPHPPLTRDLPVGLRQDPADLRRIVRTLAISRLFLSLCALALSLFEPGGNRALLQLFFAAFTLYSLAAFLALDWKPDAGFRFRLLFGLADIAGLATLAVLAGGSSGAFFVLALFILCNTAYHWGLRAAVGTGILMGAMLFAGHAVHALYAHSQSIIWDSAFLRGSLIPFAYVLVACALVAFGAMEIRKLHSERMAIARVLGNIKPNAGMKPTLSRVCADLLAIFGARRILLVVHEKSGGKVHLVEAEPYNPEESVLRIEEIDEDQCDCYLFHEPGRTWAMDTEQLLQGKSSPALVLDPQKWRVRDVPVEPPVGFLSVHPCKLLLAHSFDPRPEWGFRTFIMDPDAGLSRGTGLQFLYKMSSRVWPALFELYLARRSRHRAAQLERASLARELHDGVIQSLVTVDLKLQSLRNGKGGNGDGVSAKLENIQEYLRSEVRSLRNLMQRLRRPDVDPGECVQALRSAASQFQEDSGITARFESWVEEVALPPRICGEMLRIVQEALVNVRKHSAAHSVEILLRESDHSYALEIKDDGDGFDFQGRLSLQDLEAQGKGPEILKERVRLVAGDLAIDSTPGQGTRLEITIPRAPHD